MHHPTDRIAHTTAFVTPVVEHWLEREIAQVTWTVDIYTRCRTEVPWLLLDQRKACRQGNAQTSHPWSWTHHMLLIYFALSTPDERERERNVLFNDALNTFYLRLYGRERNILFNDALNTFYLRLYGTINSWMGSPHEGMIWPIAP